MYLTCFIHIYIAKDVLYIEAGSTVVNIRRFTDMLNFIQCRYNVKQQ